MRNGNPSYALSTLDLELETLCADVPKAGAMLERRLDTILQLLPVIGGVAQTETNATERAEAISVLERMKERCAELEDILRDQLRNVSAELSQLRVGRSAAAGYGALGGVPQQGQLDKVG